MVPRVLVVAQLPAEWLEPLQAAGLEIHLAPELAGDHAALCAAAADADAIVSMLTAPIDAEVLSAGALGRLRVVANIAVGYDNIDVAAARRLHVAVCNTPGVLDSATADVAMLLILAACRGATAAQASLRAGGWHGWEMTGYLGKDLAGARLGLVGFGGVGQAVGARAAAFDMQVRHHARRPTGQPGYVPDLDTLLSESDVVSIHVPLSPETLGLFGTERIGRMPRGSILVNTARGGIVDEAALVDALASGQLAGAGLDVFDGEPNVSPRLLSAPRLTLLPHIGSATWATREAMTRMACQGAVDVLAGRMPANLVTKG
jgi:glyoxylate reductase